MAAALLARLHGAHQTNPECLNRDVKQSRGPLRLLLASHDASATGAPNSLLDLAAGMRALGAELRILLLREGPLESAFAALGPTHVVCRDAEPEPRVVLRRTLNGLAKLRLLERSPARRWGIEPLEKMVVARFLRGFEPDLLFINSIAAAPVLGYLRKLPDVVVTRAREMEQAIQSARRMGWFEDLVRSTSRFLAVSEAVKRNLIANHEVAADRLLVLPTYIDVGRLGAVPRAAARRRLLELAGGRPFDSFVVGCGTTDWNKGPDLFLAIAKASLKRDPSRRTGFIWIGGMDSPAESRPIRLDLERAALEQHVFFPGFQADAATLVAGADVLALTSREDSFPRVMLEAGLGGVPTIGFHGSGGFDEFAALGCGIAAEFLDVGGFADVIGQVLSDDALRARMGGRAREVVRENHDAETCVPRIHRVLAELVEASRRG